GEQLLCLGIELLNRRQSPQEHTRVEQILHRPPRFFLPFPLERKLARTLAGSEASKSSEIRMRSCSIPSRRRPPACSSGTRRATGTPRLAMVISSPAATRCRRLESCVLASWIFTLDIFYLHLSLVYKTKSITRLLGRSG